MRWGSNFILCTWISSVPSTICGRDSSFPVEWWKSVGQDLQLWLFQRPGFFPWLCHFPVCAVGKALGSPSLRFLVYEMNPWAFSTLRLCGSLKGSMFWVVIAVGRPVLSWLCQCGGVSPFPGSHLRLIPLWLLPRAHFSFPLVELLKIFRVCSLLKPLCWSQTFNLLFGGVGGGC